MTAQVRVLVVDDSRSEYVLARELLGEADPARYTVEWASTYADGLAAVCAGRFDVALVDYQLGSATGVELIRHATAAGCRVPLILLTGRGGPSVDVEAMEAGAADYVDKAEVNPSVLDRAIRYAVRHQRALDLLRDREERFRALIENSADAMLLFDHLGTITFASESVEAISRVKPSDVVGRCVFEFIHPDDVPHFRAVLDEAISRPGIPVRTSYRARLIDGSVRDREAVLVNRLAHPAVGAIVLNFRDVTGRKAAEAQQAHLAAIVRSSNDAIVGQSLDGMILSWSPGAEQLYGYSEAEIVGRPIALLVPPHRMREHEEMSESIRRGGFVRQHETERVRKDGVCVDVSVTLSPIYDHDGAMTGISSVARDISERLRAANALRAAEERTRFTLEMAGIGLWETDFRTGRAQWTDTMASVTGIPVEQFPTTFDEFKNLVHVDDRPAVDDSIREALQRGGHLRVEFRMVAPDGAVRWHESKAQVVVDDDGSPARAFGVGMDVTERKQLEAEFRQAQKMEAIGLLAGGVAHDFNNLLTAILGYCEMIAGSVTDAQVVADVSEIRKAADRATSLTRQLLAFSRKQHVVPRVFDLNHVVRDLHKMLIRVIGEDIRIAIAEDPSAGPIKADPAQIEQVLLNLAVNARDAMPRGGRLTIEIGSVVLDTDFVRRHPGSKPGCHTTLVVRDTGCGMPADVLAHVFEPFFTTKDSGKGTGLGLATVHGIVTQSGGYINVESTPGEGTAFSLYFPVANESITTDRSRAPAPNSAAGSETILLVEDDRAVRTVIAHILRRAGYNVLVAEVTAHAIAIERTYDGPIHLLLSDVIMPDMNGPDLAQRLVRRRRSLNVLYVSGFAGKLGVNNGVMSGRTAFLHKPFTAAELTTKVRERLHTES